MLAGGLAVLLGAAGCGTGGHSAAPSTAPAAPSAPSGTAAPDASASPAASTSPSAAAALPATTPWEPGPGEVSPEVKRRAVEVVQALGAWGPGGQGAAAAQQRVAALGLPAALADQAGALLPAAPQAALQVVDAQYGGILTDSASVLVVCRQWTLAADGTLTPGGTTVDVRLSRAEPLWTVTALHPAEPGQAAAVLPTAAGQVLAEQRIQLPPAAVADLRSGTVHDSVLQTMLALARDYTFQVSVVRSGHPLDVFGTTRPSDHPQGRAFDTWQIDGHPVVDPATPAELVDGFMRAAAAAGSYNVGGPRQLSGGRTANQFFSDPTHRDHVHAGFLT